MMHALLIPLWKCLQKLRTLIVKLHLHYILILILEGLTGCDITERNKDLMKIIDAGGKERGLITIYPVHLKVMILSMLKS